MIDVATLPSMDVATRTGRLREQLAIDERSRHSPHYVAARAVGSAGKYRLSGRKVHVLDGHVADRLIVSARTSGDADSRDGITLFLLDAHAPGITISRAQNVDSRNSAVVELHDVAVSADDIIGAAEKGAAILDEALDAGRALGCLGA